MTDLRSSKTPHQSHPLHPLHPLHPIVLPAGKKVLEKFGELEKILLNQAALLPYGEDETPASYLDFSNSRTTTKNSSALLVDDNISLAIRTSGSTGTPKLILHTSAAIHASISATKSYLKGDGQWLLAIPPQYIGGLQVLLRSIDSGTTPVFLKDEKFDTQNFVNATRQLSHPKKYVSLVPTQLNILLQSPKGIEALQQFSAIILGGSAAVKADLEYAAHKNINLIISYGMSETCGGCVYNGHPLSGIEIKIGGPQQKILIKGPQISTQHIVPPATNIIYRKNPWLATADIGIWKNETLQILGRSDDIIISGGINISTKKIEEYVTKNSNITKCVALGISDKKWGNKLTLFTIGELENVLELKQKIIANIGKYAVPKQIISLSEIPLLANGKIDRQSLEKIAQKTQEAQQ